MTINEILDALATSLVSLQGRAALDHYPSLRVKTRRLQDELTKFLTFLDAFSERLGKALLNDSLVSDRARAESSELFYFRKILPRMLRNFRAVCEQMVEVAEPAPKLTVDEIRTHNFRVGLHEFNRLVMAIRQVVDNLVVDAYQFCMSDPRELSYELLTSLLSFVRVAPPSLQAPIVSDKLQAAVQTFSALTKTKRRNSPISKSAHPTFSAKADYIGRELSPAYHEHVIDNLHAVFSFCSEFAHVGYVSTLVTSNDSDQVFLGGREDTFLPSFENFAKLKHQLVRESVIFICDLYLPSLKRLIRIFVSDPNEAGALEKVVDDTAAGILVTLKETDHEVRIQPIAKGLKQSGQPIKIECACGGACEWKAPHYEWYAYCDRCGSKFQTFEVSPLHLYALSNQGIGDVVGAAGPRIDALDSRRRERLNLVWKNVRHKLESTDGAMQFSFVGNPDAFSDDGESLSGKVLRVPPREKWQIGAWVAETAILNNEEIAITCNCGQTAAFLPPYETEVIACRSCGFRRYGVRRGERFQWS